MRTPRRLSARALSLALAAAFGSACSGMPAGSAPMAMSLSAGAAGAASGVAAAALTLRGRVTFDADNGPEGYRTQAAIGEVANAATVSLIDARTGNTVSSSVSDAQGGFVLTFRNFNPVPGAPYTLEAVKGLSVGGKVNRPGAPAVRVRTLLFWIGGWQSLTNTTPGKGITVSSATTAVATLISLKRSAGQDSDLSRLVGRVSGSDFDATGTDLSRESDFDPVLALVRSALLLDQDPVAAIAYDGVAGTYRLAPGVPTLAALEPALPVPGGSLTLRGAGFDKLGGRNRFWFGDTPAATWSVSDDRTTATVAVPASAYAAPFTLELPGGALHAISPFLPLRGTVGTLAGDGVSGYADGKGSAARFNWSWGMAVDAAGNVYVGDASNQRIRKIRPDGTVTTFAGTGTAGLVDGPALSAQFRSPHMLAFEPDGSLLVVDLGNNAIRRIRDGAVSTVVGSAGGGYAEGPVATAKLSVPHGVAVAPGGDIFVSDYNNNRIRKISGGVVSTFAGDGTAGFSDGSPGSARFSGPISLRFDKDGNLIVPDRFNARIRKVAPDGTVSTLVGTGVSGFKDGPGLSAQVNWPNGVVPMPNGDIYFTEEFSYRIRKLGTDGNVVTVAGNGVSANVDGAALGNGRIGRVGDIAGDSRGVLYFADMGEPRIRILVP